MTATPIKLETGPDPMREARVDLAAAYRLAARFGYDDGIWNHFTLTVPGASCPRTTTAAPAGYGAATARTGMS